ncbi:MAG: M24 family metallopeptidase [Sphingobium sp.]
MIDPAAHDFRTRQDRLLRAEGQAMALLARIEAEGLVRPGRSERDVERDIVDLARDAFGVTTHWHKRIVRSGPHGVLISSDNPPPRIIDEDDLVWVDLGPVFEDWEADVGRSYALGGDARKAALVRDLPLVFHALQSRFHADADATGAALYALACREAEARGWLFGGRIAGHIVSEFAHARIPGDKEHNRISPDNPTRLRDPDGWGREKFWILEVHLVSPDRSFGGFYERLLPFAPEARPTS